MAKNAKNAKDAKYAKNAKNAKDAKDAKDSAILIPSSVKEAMKNGLQVQNGKLSV